ncbi:MAG: type II toxin-antitoxin system PemK/MazF family toxin [Acidobacteriia bacterium]|nr:type II toxin-antitoxin system PemK/MazF family toxin [Terriglobia bacterium]
MDRLRTVDRQRLVRRLGALPARTAQAVSSMLIEMFIGPERRSPTA